MVTTSGTASEQENLGLMDVIKDLHSQDNGILVYRRMTLFVNRKLETSHNKKPDLTLDTHSRYSLHYFYNHQRFQKRNNGLALLEMRNKAVA